MCSQRAGVVAPSRSLLTAPRVVGPAPSYRAAHAVLRPADSPGRGSEGEGLEIYGEFLELEEIKAILKESCFISVRNDRHSDGQKLWSFKFLHFFSSVNRSDKENTGENAKS